MRCTEIIGVSRFEVSVRVSVSNFRNLVRFVLLHYAFKTKMDNCKNSLSFEISDRFLCWQWKVYCIYYASITVLCKELKFRVSSDYNEFCEEDNIQKRVWCSHYRLFRKASSNNNRSMHNAIHLCQIYAKYQIYNNKYRRNNPSYTNLYKIQCSINQPLRTVLIIKLLRCSLTALFIIFYFYWLIFLLK